MMVAPVIGPLVGGVISAVDHVPVISGASIVSGAVIAGIGIVAVIGAAIHASRKRETEYRDGSRQHQSLYRHFEILFESPSLA
jgi:hypothetical protein